MKSIWVRYITTCFIAASFAIASSALQAQQNNVHDSATYQGFTPASPAISSINKPSPMYPVVQTDTSPITSASHFYRMRYCPSVPICPGMSGTHAYSADPYPSTTVPNYMYAQWGAINPETLRPGFTMTVTPTLSTLRTYPDTFCPDQCVVTRDVTRDASNRITSVNEAICPDGYVQVGSFNMQDEIVYREDPTDGEYPITTLQKYEEYIDKGYFCVESESGVTQSPCKTSQSLNSNTTHTFPYPTQTPIVFNTPSNGPAVVTFSNPRTILGNTVCLTSDNEQCIATHSYMYTFTCNLTCSIKNKQTWPTTHKDETYIYCYQEFGIAYKMIFEMPYKLIKCTMPAGLIYSENKTPASVVCARKKPVFQKR